MNGYKAVFQGQMIKSTGQGTGNNLPHAQGNMFNQGYYQVCLQIKSFTDQNRKLEGLDGLTEYSLLYFSL
jgi:hypothetical protein